MQPQRITYLQGVSGTVWTVSDNPVSSESPVRSESPEMSETTPVRGYSASKDQLQKRLARIEERLIVVRCHGRIRLPFRGTAHPAQQSHSLSQAAGDEHR